MSRIAMITGILYHCYQKYICILCISAAMYFCCQQCVENTATQLPLLFFIRPGRRPGAYLSINMIKFILPEFVFYLVEWGVLCVGNGRHFCTPVLTNMSNITFEVLYVWGAGMESVTHITMQLSENIQCCFNVGPASKTVGQHWNSIG